MNHVYTELLGKKMEEVFIKNDEMHFVLENGRHYKFYHEQDCCETVMIDDINGNLIDLIGEELLIAEETSSISASESNEYESVTWTFYKFATKKGYVNVKWFGESNGYYSEDVDFCEVENNG